MPIPILENLSARHLFLAKHGLAETPSGPGNASDMVGVIDDLGFVQVDSVNTFARAHDQILWARRQQYRPKVMDDLLSRDRVVFEHWTHDASVIPIAAFGHWRLRMARDEARLADHWKEWHQHEFLDKVDAVLRHISDGGPCNSGQVGKDEKRGKGGWWDWHPSKTALEYLWRSGQLSVLRRDGFTKVYDLTERVIPAAQLAVRYDLQDTVEWCCAGAMDRLGFATSGEIAAFWAVVTPAEAKAWCKAALADRRLIEVDVQCVDGTLRRSFAWPDVMDCAVSVPASRVRILSPFDPALRDRKRAERLFGFHYRIEIFVPAPKRQYGYYVFPVMEGAQLIGRIDMKRVNGRLEVAAFWSEGNVRFGSGRRARLIAELSRAAKFGGCGNVIFAENWVR